MEPQRLSLWRLFRQFETIRPIKASMEPQRLSLWRRGPAGTAPCPRGFNGATAPIAVETWAALEV